MNLPGCNKRIYNWSVAATLSTFEVAMIEDTDRSSEELRPAKVGWGISFWLCFAAFALLLYALLFPSFAWTGAAWLTINVRVIDSESKTPISGVNVTLLPDPPLSPGRLAPDSQTAQTDIKGIAVLRYMFGAGGGTHNTTIAVRASRIRCEAKGYLPVEVRVAEERGVRFWRIPLFGPRKWAVSRIVELQRELK